MMAVLECAFSGFWNFVGVYLLLNVVAGVIISVTSMLLKRHSSPPILEEEVYPKEERDYLDI